MGDQTQQYSTPNWQELRQVASNCSTNNVQFHKGAKCTSICKTQQLNGSGRIEPAIGNTIETSSWGNQITEISKHSLKQNHFQPRDRTMSSHVMEVEDLALRETETENPLKIPLKISPTFDKDFQVQFKETLTFNQRMTTLDSSTYNFCETPSRIYDSLTPKALQEITPETKPSPGKKTMPRIALMTSGGGFRAMIAHSGAYKVKLFEKFNLLINVVCVKFNNLLGS